MRKDFVWADMARKYLQIEFTIARTYFNYKGGKKYDAEKGYQQLEKETYDSESDLLSFSQNRFKS